MASWGGSREGAGRKKKTTSVQTLYVREYAGNYYIPAHYGFSAGAPLSDSPIKTVT